MGETGMKKRRFHASKLLSGCVSFTKRSSVKKKCTVSQLIVD